MSRIGVHVLSLTARVYASAGFVAVVACSSCVVSELDVTEALLRCGTKADCPGSFSCKRNHCVPVADHADGMYCDGATPAACAAGNVCCVTGRLPRCAAIDASCAGIVQYCDGGEDCARGENCCLVDGEAVCTSAVCRDVVCVEPTDCPAETTCCRGTDTALGVCRSDCH